MFYSGLVPSGMYLAEMFFYKKSHGKRGLRLPWRWRGWDSFRIGLDNLIDYGCGFMGVLNCYATAYHRQGI